MKPRLRSYIVPNVLAMLGTSCYILADTLFIAMAEGADGITALNLVLPVYGVIYALGAMVGVGSATRYSLQKAMGRPDADLYFSNALLCTLLLSLPFVAAGLWFPGPVLALLGADAGILGVGVPYLQLVLCFAPFFMLNYTCTAFVRNDGGPRVAMAATLISGVFNILFDYLLMFPLGLGMRGAALATAFSPIVSILICQLHYRSGRCTVVLVCRPPSLSRFLSSCKLGTVALVGELSSGITTLVFNFLLLGLGGNLAVAAYGIVANIAIVGISLLNGVSQGLQPLVSSVHGACDAAEERRLYLRALAVGWGIALCFAGAVLFWSDPLVAVFNREGDGVLAQYAKSGLLLYMPGFLPAAFNMVRAGFLSATGNSLDSSVIALSRGVAAIVLFAWLLSALLGIPGVWLAFPVAEAATALLSLGLSALRARRRAPPSA